MNYGVDGGEGCDNISYMNDGTDAAGNRRETMTDRAADEKETTLRHCLGRRKVFRAAMRGESFAHYDAHSMKRATEIARRCLEPTDLERELGGREAVKAWLAART